MRVGEDVAPTWQPDIPILHGVLAGEFEFPSTRNAIHNILTRAPLHHRWWSNDPDCLLPRPEPRSVGNGRTGRKHKNKPGLALPEIQALATAISLCGGSYLLSDNLALLPEGRIRLAASLLPHIDRRPFVLDWFDTANPARIRLDLDGAAGRWHLLALINWDDAPLDAILNLDEYKIPSKGPYWVRSFWEQKTTLVENGCYTINKLAPHGALLLAVRPVTKGIPQYLGSDLHISQGLEITGWQTSDHCLNFSLDLPRRVSGQVELSFPDRPLKIIQGREGGQALPFRLAGENRCLIDIAFKDHAELEVCW